MCCYPEVALGRVLTRPEADPARPDPYVVNFLTRPDPTRHIGKTRVTRHCKNLTRNDPKFEKI